MKKTLLIDARMIESVGHGIAQYVTDLADSMSGHWGDWQPVFLISDQCPSNHRIRSYETVASEVPFLSKAEPWRLSKEIKKLSPQAFLSPSFSSLWKYPCPHWIICHDLNHLQFGNFLQRQYYRWLLLPALKSAKGTATVSNTAKKELEHWMELEGNPRSFQVIPNVVRPFSIGKNPTPLKEFFFCLSNSKPHKNVEWLRLLHDRAHAQGCVPMISNVGGSTGGWNAIKDLKTDQIGLFYSEAKAFFFPSLYEGFGRPPVEAALMGTLPVVSDIPVHREALRGVKEAIFLPLHEEGKWIQAMLELSGKPKIFISQESKNWILQEYSSERQREAFKKFFP